MNRTKACCICQLDLRHLVRAIVLNMIRVITTTESEMSNI